MLRRVPILLAGLVALPVYAQLNPNGGAFSAKGVLNDHDGNRGEWAAQGALKGGAFQGQMAMVLGGKAMKVSMDQAYVENGFCVLRGVDGRNRFELRGKCSPTSFGPGVAKGYFDGDRDFTGEFSGTIQFGAAARVPAKAGIVPTGKLMCIYRERVGGVVAGDIGTRMSRPSAMVSLTLSGGHYQTRNGGGAYTVRGDRVRLTSGPFAGAVGELRADNSGAPAVYFNVEDNRAANGRPIVDPWTTACATQR